jgi:AcrR family transcriptional regulator
MPPDSISRVSAHQWLSKALELFAKTGEGGLRVETLARSLNVSKSGFYFHFKDRDDFLQKLIDYWAHEYTEVVVKNPLLAMTPPRERLLMISTFVFEQNLTEFDAAMYVWANKEPKIAQRVRKVTEMRLAFAGKAFAELGFEGDDLAMRTRLFVAFISAERQIYGPNKKTAQRYRELRLELLLSKPA